GETVVHEHRGRYQAEHPEAQVAQPPVAFDCRPPACGDISRAYTAGIYAHSEVPHQVEPRVEVSDELAITVEHQGVTASELTDAPLGCLAPPRVIDFGVDVGVEAVLVWRHDVPGVGRLLGGEGDLHYRLDAL